jgi:pimeloyl-ACP methyl ester carboxylesterase
VTGPAAVSGDETLAYIPAGDDFVFGVLSYPTVQPVGCAVVHLPAGGAASSGHTRETVTLSRSLAGLGYHSMRLDYHGVADSTGIAEVFRLDQPFLTDVNGVLKWIDGMGIDRFALVGMCFGARTALAAAAQEPHVGLAVLTSPPVRDFEMGAAGGWATSTAVEVRGWQLTKRTLRVETMRNLFDRKKRRRYVRIAKAKLGLVSGGMRKRKPDSWVSSAFLREMSALVERHVPTLFIYGAEDKFWREFELARQGRLGRLLTAAGDLVEVVSIPGSIHDGRSLITQERTRELITEWLSRHRTDLPKGSESRSAVGLQLD